jgi:hypothetical protein
MQHNTLAPQQLDSRDLADVSGGMRFNPNAKLDTSQIDDYRRGQPFFSKVRAWWTQITH